MSALFFLIRRHLKNTIRRAFRKPAVLVGYIFVVLFLIAAIFSAFAMPSGLVRASSPSLFRGIVMLVFTFLYYTSLKIGIDKGSSFFRMADVNLVFTSPLSPNKILIYGFIKQLGGTLLLVFMATFQIPNLKNNFEFKPHGVIVLLLAVVAYALAYPLISMVIYSCISVSRARRRMVKRIFDVTVLIIVLIFLLDLYHTRNFVQSLIHVFDSPIAHYFPVIGWTGSIASAAVGGFTQSFIFGLVAMVVIVFGLSLLLFKMKLDYYEDVLEATEYVETVLKANREGRSMTVHQKIRKNIGHGISGKGARALFTKNLLEIRKTSLFLFIDRMSVTVIIAGILFKFLMPSEMSGLPMVLVLAFSSYMLLLMQVQGRWSSELDKPYIYLIPASSLEKLFYSTLSDHVKNLFDGALLFTLSGILFDADIPTILSCILTYTIFGAIFMYADALARRLFGRIHSKGLVILVKIILSIVLIVPGIIAAVIAGIATQSEFFIAGALGAWAFVLAITLFIFSSTIFNNIEAAS